MAVDELTRQLRDVATALGAGEEVEVRLERPRNPEHGDLASNLAMTLAGRLKRPPRDIAQDILGRLDLESADLQDAEVAGPGFINFRFAPTLLHDRLSEILEQDGTYGRSAEGAGRRVQVEFVSANPTGPLHVAHGRGAALGDAIASLLEWTGHGVEREFYVNDAGGQIERLAESLEARWLQGRGEEAAVPEGGYMGEYVAMLAEELNAARGSTGDGDERPAALEELDRPERLRRLREFAIERLLEEQKRDLRAFGVHFDSFFRESLLYTEEKIEETLEELEQAGVTYRDEGALWLRTTDFGDDKDRVLIKSDGTYTYFLPDAAYHREKARRGFDRAIDVWGADHHGYIRRMKAALTALGLPDFLDVEIVQLVRITRGGREVRLSKRAGEFVTLRELFEETGPDVARYFFLMRRGDTQMLFDLDLALDHSEKNPVYKVQYAHARMMSIFGRAGIDPAAIDVEGAELARLEEPNERELIRQLQEFPGTVTSAAEAHAPHMICDYLETTAGMVNSWYHAGNPSRNPELAVLSEDPELRTARLALAAGVRIVLRNGLELLGLTAPNRMEREQSE